MLKIMIACFFLFSSSFVLAQDQCSLLQEEIDLKLKVMDETIFLFNEGFTRVENSNLECSDVSHLILFGNEILKTDMIIREKAEILEENCGVVTPISEEASDVSLRLPYIHFYKIINCGK